MDFLKEKSESQSALVEGLLTPAPGASRHIDLPALQNGPVLLYVRFAESSNEIQTMTLEFRQSGKEETRLTAHSRGAKPPPVGFGTQHYEAESPKGRFRFEPVIGEQLLDPEKALDCPTGYRFQEIADRLSRGPVEYRWILEKSQDDRGSEVELGRLSLQRLQF